MNIASAGALLIAAMIATSAMGTVTTTVVDVPTRGVTQRFLYLHPDAPAANIVSLPGGDGILGIQNDGTMTTFVAQCSPVGRNRQAFADHGFAVALVDATSDGLTYNFDDVLEVVRYMQARDNVPVWVIGGSSATAAIWTLANHLPTDAPVGAIFWSPGSPVTSQVALIKRPTQVVYNPLDFGQFGAAFFAALTSAPVREQAVLTGGTNAGCGYHLFNGLDAEFVAATTGFIDKYNGTLTGVTPVNVQGLWWAAPAGSESGWGINFAHQGDIVFASWFTYDLTGKGLWLVMTAPKIAPNTYSGTLYTTTGPAFTAVPFDPAQVVPTAMGTGTLSFTDGSSGSFAYTVNGVSQIKAITREVFGPLPGCATASASLGAATNYQDLWWAAPAGVESGWGINFTHQGDTIFATWFTYDVDHTPMWLVVTAGKTGPGLYTGTLYRTTGPAFNAVPFNPALVVAAAVGTATFTFSDGNNAIFAYTVNGVSQSKAITREVFQNPGTVCQ